MPVPEPLPFAIGTSAACSDPNVSPAGTGTNGPASAAVSRAVEPEPAAVFVSPWQGDAAPVLLVPGGTGQGHVCQQEESSIEAESLRDNAPLVT